jgi:germacradienol/geosmin synthase
MSAFVLPPLSLPFSLRINPHHDVAEEASRSWFRSMGFDNLERVMHEYESNRSCDLVARAFPDAGQLELEHLTNLVFWMFLLDDGLDQGALSLSSDEGRKRLERMFSLLSAPAGEARPQTPLERSGVLMIAPMLEAMTGEGGRRLLEEIRMLFSWVAHEVQRRSCAELPDLLAYAHQRRFTSAARVVFRAGEYANHAEVPAVFHQSRLFETLQDSATDVITLVNDLISYEKEAEYGEINNYVVVCQQLLGSSIDDAVAFLLALLDARLQCFQRERKRVAGFIEKHTFSNDERQAIRRYVQMLEDWMSANLDWSLRVPRYNDLRNGPRR